MAVIKPFLLISAILLSFSLQAQSIKEVLQKMNENYDESKLFSVDLKYTLFKGRFSDNISKQYYGKAANTTYGSYQRIDMIEMISTSDFALMLDEESRTISYNLPTESSVLRNIDQALSNASEKSLSSKGDSYIITLTYSGASNSNLSRVIISIDKESYRIHLIDLLYSNQINFANSFGAKDYAYPHLRIEYSNYSNKPSIPESKFELSNYITIKKENKIETLAPSSSYSTYEVIDNRYKY